MNQTLKGALYTLTFFALTEMIYKLFTRKRLTTASSHQSCSAKNGSGDNSRLSSTSLQVLFFPDKVVACREYFIGDGCFKDYCQFSHDDTSLSRLFHHLVTAKVSMDICVFLITCKDLADIILKLHKNGIKIRLITDSEQLHCDGSQIWNLRKEGIPVRTHKSSFLMHHKFAIKDNQVLINGSFNWTRQAITGNQENVIISEDPSVTSLFVKEFQRLWEEFDPNTPVLKN